MENNNIIESLREKTIKLIHQSPKRSLIDYSDMTQEQLLEELNNYHIELLAQNDELEIANKRLEDTSILFNAMFYNAPIGYLLLDDKYKIIEVNTKALEILQLKKDNFNNLRLITYIGKGQIQKFLDWSLKDIETELEIELNISHKKFFVILKKTYWQDKHNYIFLTINDITIKKEKERLAIEKKRISSLTNMLNTIAHYWRQPLTVISLSINMILEKYKKNTLDEEFITQKVQQSLDNIKNLSSSIDSFRTVVEYDKTKLSNFNIKDLFQDIFYALEQQNIKYDIKDDILPSFIFADRTKLSEVLFNTITFKEISKDINKREISTKIDNNIYRISIKQKGNLDKNKLKDIFEPILLEDFKKHEISSLYVAKVIIENQIQGELSLKNNDKDIEIVIELPIIR